MKLVAAGSVQAAHGHYHLPKVVTETWPFVPIGIYYPNLLVRNYTDLAAAYNPVLP